MFEEVEKLTEQLNDTEAGWVNRRDAAEYLGKTAVQAVEALLKYIEDPDVDVRSGVERAAGWASSALQGVKPFSEDSEYSLEDLVKGIEKEGERTVTARGKAYDIDIQLPEGRSQKVSVAPIRPDDRPPYIRVYTRCGKPTDKAHVWALRTNMSTVQCAIALTEEDGEEMLVMVNCFLASEVTPREIKAAVKEIAYYGDWIEKKMTGDDVF